MTETFKIPNEQRTKCEIWTRVMGYHRPVSAFNKGKQTEFRDRTYFCESSIDSRNSVDEKEID